MMMAVLPARQKAGYDHLFKMVKNTWLPSNAALEAGNGQWRFEEERQVWAGSQRNFDLNARHWQPIYNEEGKVVDYLNSRKLRVDLLLRAEEEMREWEVLEPLTVPLAVELKRELQSLLHQMTNGGGGDENDEWLEWGFEFPEYASPLVVRDDLRNFVPWPQLTPGHGAGVGPGGGGNVQANPAQVAEAGQRVGRQPTKYFTVSEIGDMRLALDPDDERTNWILVRDEDGGQEIYDIAGEFAFQGPSIYHSLTVFTTLQASWTKTTVPKKELLWTGKTSAMR